MSYQEFIKPELLILIPVLYFIGAAIKKSKIKDNFIPFILGFVGVFFAGVYLFAAEGINGSQAVATAIFTAFTQGVLCAAASVYANQLIKQARKDNNDEKENEKEE
jgi:drug/metabolite transporter (DMT)-like permease